MVSENKITVAHPELVLAAKCETERDAACLTLQAHIVSGHRSPTYWNYAFKSISDCL